MRFIEISTKNDSRIHLIFNAYCNAFPADERRDATQFQHLFEEEKAKIIAIEREANIVGYLILWELNHFCFLEHFEIFPSYRNRKLGSQVLTSLKQHYPTIVLESEPAHLDDTARQRIAFYERNGFSVLNSEYIQPAYDPSKNAINLWLMGNFSAENIEAIVEDIYKTVYQFSLKENQFSGK